MRYFVYILYSPSLNIYYKGYTQNVEFRLLKHLSSHNKFTSKAKDWTIVYTKEFLSKKKALIEEKRLKKLNKRSLIKLINSKD